MRILLVGARGTIGRAVAAALTDHTVVAVGHREGDLRVELADAASVHALYAKVGSIDAVVSAAGRAIFKPLAELSEADFEVSLRDKLMGQVNLVRFGLPHLREGGSITLSTGSVARHPIPGGAAIALVNGALEAFVRAAAIEAPRHIRINAVSPGWVAETLAAMGRDPAMGTPAAVVARAYVEAITGKHNGDVLEVGA